MDLRKVTNKIIVKGKNYDMPFSKGILARSLTAAGMKPSEAYNVAREIEKMLNERGVDTITKEELRRIVYDYLISKNYESIAEKYLLWSRVLNKHPIIILLGGASGVGTSTIAFELASRLGIPSVIGTDSIREVMRRSISKDLAPMLYESSYTAWKSLRVPSEINNEDIHILGFERHVELVLVGVESVIDRCLKEGLSVIIEGTHIIPGFMKEKYEKMPNIITLILTLSSEKMHKERFAARAKITSRPLERYLKHFEIIRKINDYITKKAHEYNVPVIENISISDSVEKCLEVITERFIYLEKVNKEY